MFFNKMSKLVFTFSFLFFTTQIFSQTNSVIFTVNDKPTYTDEFSYIYNKSNGIKADYSRASLEEYLDLYTKFKLKVAWAREHKIDTIPSLKEELQSYRRQLSESYLTDKEVTERLGRELHDRMKRDVSISHILFHFEKNDTAAAYTRAVSVLQQLEKNQLFEVLAGTESDDTNNKAKGGYIGYLTAILPDGFYDLETAIYNTPVGKISGIVRSPLGYHIIKVNEERPARGEIEISHILIRKKKEGIEQPNAKMRADSIATALKNGGNFEAMATSLSEDGGSSTRGGYLGVIGIGRYEKSFEDGAFALTKDGEVTPVIESSIGYHVIKRISKKDLEPFDQAKNKIKAKITKDSRFQLAKSKMVERIKRESPFAENTAVEDAFAKNLDSTFITYNWRVPTNNPTDADVLFVYGGKQSSTVKDFNEYLATHANNRITYALQNNKKLEQTSRTLLNDFADEKALTFEETMLDTKYPDFRNLMREFEEGILLFEAMKQNIWDKASLDTLGLEKFYANNKSRYNWNQRSQIIYYNLSDTAMKSFDAITKYATKHSPQEVVTKFNKKSEWVTFKEEMMESGKGGKILDPSMMKANTIIQNKQGQPRAFMKVEKVIPISQKTLKEARGFVVADYQDYLESQWIAELTKKYKLTVNRDVLLTLVKK